jgi:putative transposase
VIGFAGIRSCPTLINISFCIDGLEEAIVRTGAPEIFNTDQGSQFTSDAFTGVLESHEKKLASTVKVVR